MTNPHQPELPAIKVASNEMAEIHARLLTEADNLLSYAIRRSNLVPEAATHAASRPADGVPDRKSLFKEAEVLAACYRLKQLVEGPGCERWQNGNGFRLKDTQEWVEFYNVVSAMSRLELPTASAPTSAQAGDEVSRMDAIVAAYNQWPADIRKKLSLHDLRRMTGWVPPTGGQTLEDA